MTAMATIPSAQNLCVFVPVFNEIDSVEQCRKAVLGNDLVK